MNEKKTLWVIPIIGLAFIALIFIFDLSHTKDITITRDLSARNDSLRKEREIIPVEMRVFRELVADLKNKSNFSGIQGPKAQNDGDDFKVVLDVKDVSTSGKNKLLGEPENARWKAYYNKDNNLHFNVEIKKNGDTVVNCPAYIFAKMVELCEK